jgi:hypothetical protein
VGGEVAVGHHLRVDRGAQVLGGELAAIPKEPALPDATGLERLDAGEEARLGGAERRLHGAHLGGRLDLALGPERVGPEVEADPAGVELHREAEGEALRHLHAAEAELLQGESDHVGGGGLAAVLLERGRDLGPRQHAVHVGLLARAVHLEVAHDEEARLPLLDEEERVRREEAGRVEDVGVRLGGGVEEASFGRAARLRLLHAVV